MTSFDRSIGRLLIAVTYVAGALLFIGVLLMLVEGISPLSGGPRLDLSTIVADVTSLQPAGFLWLGLITVIATPITRVIAAAVGFAQVGERQMVLVAVAIVGVIALSIVTAIVTGGAAGSSRLGSSAGTVYSATLQVPARAHRAVTQECAA